jgi:HEAT repeat protein
VEELSDPGGRAKHTYLAQPDTFKLHLKAILSSDYVARLEATGQLKQHGKAAAEAILQMMVRASDLSAFPALTHALEEIGRPCEEAILSCLEGLDIRRERDVYLTECLVGVLRHLRDRRSSPVIARIVDRYNAIIQRNGNSVLVSVCQHAKLKAHVVLGELGDRSRVDDLLEQVQRDHRLINPGIIQVLAEIGGRRALGPLLRVVETVDSAAIQDDAVEAIRRIVRREKLPATDPVFGGLSKGCAALLAKVFKPNGGNGQA